MSRAALWRAVVAVATALALYVVLWFLDFDPDPLRLALLVLVCLAAVGLFLDTFGTDEATWGLEHARWNPQPGQDQGFSSYVRVIESHLTVDVPDGVLRDRLATLATLRLEQRYGLVVDDPRSVELLGPELSGVLAGAPRRMDRAEIERHVRRLEEL